MPSWSENGQDAVSNYTIHLQCRIPQPGDSISWRRLVLQSVCLSSASDMTSLQEEAGGADDDARARDAMYDRAERLATSLARMGEQLRTAIDNVNAASASQVNTR